jgi:hypothetical protein
LTDVREVDFEFKNFQSEGFSPVCGCDKEQRPEDWRGITFAARHVNLRRQGRLPLTAYMITVAAPKKITWSSPGERFNVDLYFLSIPKNEPFIASGLNTNPSYRIIEKKHFKPQRLFMVFSEQSLDVDLLGDKPLGAWIPGDSSKVKIGSSKGMFPSAKPVGSIREDYDIRFSESELQEIVGIPMGDFLGPNIVLSSLDPKASIMVGKEMFSVPEVGDQNRVVTALVANPPFALRVACLPEDVDAVPTYTSLINEPDVKAAKEDYVPAVRHPEDESGSVHVSIPDVLDGEGEFNQIYHRMKENDIVRIPNVPGDFILVDAETGKKMSTFNNLKWMEFRYPPIPPNPGFNVFGSFKSMTFNDVKGKLLLGSRGIDIGAPSDLALREISLLRVEGGVIQVPLSWDLKGNTANIQLRATAHASLNGTPLANSFDSYKDRLEYIVGLSAIVSAVAAIVQLLLARKATKR